MEILSSSSSEEKLLLHSSDPYKTENDAVSHENPQSRELGYITPQSSETDATPFSSPPDQGSVLVIDEELKLQQQHQEKQYASGVNGGFRDGFGSENAPDEDAELRKTLHDEILKVIFVEALNEAVMNLALKDKNVIEGDVKLQNFINEGEISGLSLGVTAVEEKELAFTRASISGLKEANNYQNNVNRKEGEIEIKYEVNEEGNDAKINSGDVDEKEGQNGNHENDNEEDNDGTEEGENGGDHVGLNEDGGYSAARNYFRRFEYPLRPGADDCAYYMKTGNCKFEANCKFNHPPGRRNQGNKEKIKTRIEDSEQLGQTECKYYLTPVGCKYGKACKYNHCKERSAVPPILEFNFLGLPIRLGEKECPYYMRTGSCKYGSNCRFNHPDPTSVAGTDHPASHYGNGVSVQLQSAALSTPSSWSPMPVMFPPTLGVPSSNSEWNGYQAPVYPTSERSLPTPPAFAMNNPATEGNFYAPCQLQMPIEEYPERPGQPECSYFLKTGDCKYRSNCRYHHPKIQMSKSTSCPLSDKGLPLRPDQSICSYYNRYGICKFGPACKFDHPENWGSSTSSDGARMATKEMEASLS